jgi:hypothetical protein
MAHEVSVPTILFYQTHKPRRSDTNSATSKHPKVVMLSPMVNLLVQLQITTRIGHLFSVCASLKYQSSRRIYGYVVFVPIAVLYSQTRLKPSTRLAMRLFDFMPSPDTTNRTPPNVRDHKRRREKKIEILYAEGRVGRGIELADGAAAVAGGNEDALGRAHLPAGEVGRALVRAGLAAARGAGGAGREGRGDGAVVVGKGRLVARVVVEGHGGGGGDEESSDSEELHCLDGGGGGLERWV